jgi:hypothetical protein
MKITLEQKHIEQGIRNNPRQCPIALAINERLDGYFASVGPFDLVLIPASKKFNRFCRNPLEFKAFMNLFDKGQPVEPFTFDLDIEKMNLGRLPE